MTDKEVEELLSNYTKAYETFKSFQDKVSNHFMLKAKKFLEDGYIENARDVISECPDMLTNCFILDAIRVAEGKYK